MIGGMERANDAILALIDQLQLTREEGLKELHWLTLQRINYEYGGIFEKNILAGDYELLTRLVAANKEIDAEVIREVEKNPPDEHWYIETMIHRSLCDMPLRYGETAFSPPYVIEPLWRIMHPNGCQVLIDENRMLKTQMKILETRVPTNTATGIKQSPFFIRKIRGGLCCLREHGFLYTVRLFFKKIKNHLL